MSPEIFIELSKLLVITFLVTAVVKVLKQPMVIGYIFSGIVAGPAILNIISSTETFATFSHIGIALLLFFVGLNLNPKVIKDIGKVSLITGLGQVIFTSGVGFIIIIALGFAPLTAAYMAIALAFSSTIIIMKLLSDKKDLESVYGRISMGFLIIQDFVAILILLLVSSLGKGSSLTSVAIEAILKGISSIGLLFLVTIYVLPRVTNIIAKSQEFLLLFSISWCFAISTLFYYLNFSIEAGALLAGMALSLSPYHVEISAKLKPLRDFFLIVFFIILGSQMIFSNVWEHAGVILLLSMFVLIGNPIIVMMLMGGLKYTKRNSFLAGLTVAQISEFSLIVISMGMSAGHVSQEVLSIVTAVGLITFAGSTYMILYSNKMYSILSPYLNIFERKGPKVDKNKTHVHENHDIILFGYNRIGFDILQSLNKLKKKFLIIDYDPEVIAQLAQQGYDCKYGDANDSELLGEINFARAEMVISTIPNTDTNLLLLHKAKEENDKVIVAVVSHQIEDAVKLYDNGATYVIMPHFLGGKHFSMMIEEHHEDTSAFLREKIKHLEHIDQRKRFGHKHPTYEH